MMLFLLPLMLLSAPSRAFDFTRLNEVIEDVYNPDLVFESMSRDYCPEDHSSPKKCKRSGTTFSCCSITDEQVTVCLNCTYTNTDNSYKCFATANDKTIFDKVLTGKGKSNQACTKVDEKEVKTLTCVYIECQKQIGSKLERCARIGFDYDLVSQGIEGHVVFKYGCLSF